jgi:hypothetical protein
MTVTMCSFMSNDKLDQLIDGLRGERSVSMNHLHDQIQFCLSSRPQACRPVSMVAISNPQIYKPDWMAATGA